MTQTPPLSNANWITRATKLNDDVAHRNNYTAYNTRRGNFVWTQGDPTADTLWQRLNYWHYSPL